MRLLLVLATAALSSAQTVQSLTLQIQRTPSAALFVQRGTAYLEAGDAKQAVADYDRALEKDAMHLKALTLRAQAYTKLSRLEDAITDLSGAIALAPGDATLYLARSEAYAANGDARHAKEDREEALRLSPDILERAASKNSGSAPKDPPAPTQPAPLIRKTAAAKPAPPPATPKPETTAAKTEADRETSNSHYQRGRDLIAKGQHTEARNELNEALRMEPSNAVLYNTLGFSYYATREYKRAIELFDQALKLNPSYLNALHNRALAKRGSGDAAGYDADHRRELELETQAKAKR